MEPTTATLEMLEKLLDRVCVHLDPQSDWPPPQDIECIAFSSLNLLRLQVCLLTIYNVFVNRSTVFNFVLFQFYSFSGY